MEQELKDVERLLNEFLEKNKDSIETVIDVTVEQTIDGKQWYGGVTYKEREKPRRGHAAIVRSGR